METYITTLGDTWDIISKKVYDSEKHVGVLMQANVNYLNIVFFSSGVVLNTPELIEDKNTDLPSWR